MPAHIDYCGEITKINPDSTLTIGRKGDIEIDDNPFLHRHFLEISHRDGMLWLTNIGSSISATIADQEGLVQSWLAPGATVPIVFRETAVWFTAGPTTYEFEIHLPEAPFTPTAIPQSSDGSTTLGRVSLTPDQRLLILALAEPILRRGDRGAGAIPQSAVAAERLGWTITKFNRKLDNVCEKLTKVGVRGLVGREGKTASTRRARLVEYAIAARIVTQLDLQYLDAISN